MQSSRKIGIPKVESHFSHSIPVKMGNDFTQFLSTCLCLLALFPFCKANVLDIKCHKMYLASPPSWHNVFILCHDLAFGLANLIIFLWVTPFTWVLSVSTPPAQKDRASRTKLQNSPCAAAREAKLSVRNQMKPATRI